jgi:integrase
MTSKEQTIGIRRPKGTGAIKGPRPSDGKFRGSKVVDGVRLYTPWCVSQKIVEDRLKVLKPTVKPVVGRTLADAYGLWMSEAKITASTRGGYDTSMRNYAPPFATMPVADITREAVSSHYRRMEVRGLSVSTIRGVAAVIRGSLKYAHDGGWIASNPVIGIKLPSAKASSTDELTDEDREKILVALKGHRSEFRYLLSIVHMMRPAEVAGLRWGSVDWVEGTVDVVGQLQRMKMQVGGKPLGTVYKGSTKSSNGRRRLWLEPRTIAAAKAWKKIQSAEAASHVRSDFQIDRLASQTKRLAAAKKSGLLSNPSLYSVQPSDLVFTLRNGDPVLPRKDADTWKKLLAEAGVGHQRLYSMRHSAVNRLIRDGAPVGAVSVGAGHSTTVFTETKYGGDRSSLARALRDHM